MIALSTRDIGQLTGQQLLAKVLVSRERDPQQPDDLDVDGQRWRVYTSNTRNGSQHCYIHLWRMLPNGQSLHLWGKPETQVSRFEYQRG